MGNFVFYLIQGLMVMILVVSAVSFAGCDLIEGVIKITFWGIVIILAIIALIGYALYRFVKRRI